jgi:sulfatase maturation enzyme AslB (radical SAM superfamily)
MSKRAKIFRSKGLSAALKIGVRYLFRYMTGKPVIMNLNFNVTNMCNQNCPMCNAVITDDPNAQYVSLETFKKYIDYFVKYNVATLSISGGEPSVVPNMAAMIDYAGGKFPFGINLNTNLFSGQKITREVAEAALRNNVRIGISFDGFDDVADKLRGAKDVSKKIIENMMMVSEMKKQMKSSSTLNMHTVISDKNLHQIKRILDYSESIGWSQTLAPVNNFFYQEPISPDVPLLHHSEELEEVIRYAATKPNISISRQFLENIPAFTLGKTPKLCPYLTGIFRTNKVFLDVNGDLAICSRKAIGNINKQSIIEIFAGEKYRKDVDDYIDCRGCWMVCFVEALLAMPKWYQGMVARKMIKQYKKKMKGKPGAVCS